MSNEIISRTLLTVDRYKDIATFRRAVTCGEYSERNSGHFLRTLVWKCSLITKSLKIHTWAQAIHSERKVYHELRKLGDMAIPWAELDNEYRRGPAEVTPMISRVPTPEREKEREEDGKEREKEREREGREKENEKERENGKEDGKEKENEKEKERENGKDGKEKENEKERENGKEKDYGKGGQDQENEFQDRHKGEDKDKHDGDSLDLLQSIILDVDRLFPGDPFFEPLPIKRQLVQILFVWARANPAIGYRQGLHEILAIIYHGLYKESVAVRTSSSEEKAILTLFDSRYLAHDAFALLHKFVVNSGVASRFYESEDALWKSIERFNAMLMKVDQLIHYNVVSKLRVESQLWIIRYLRLMLSREIGDIEGVSLYWDKLVCNPYGISAVAEIVSMSVLQMLVQLKTQLVTCDFGEALSLLLHYPMKGDKYAFALALYSDAVSLYEVRGDDLKLYECGKRLNGVYNASLGEVGGGRRGMMRFEKMGMEMRLKKRLAEKRANS